jgi:hypothetical protein
MSVVSKELQSWIRGGIQHGYISAIGVTDEKYIYSSHIYLSAPLKEWMLCHSLSASHKCYDDNLKMVKGTNENLNVVGERMQVEQTRTDPSSLVEARALGMD